MHKWLMKLIAVGILGLVFAGSAFARVVTPVDTQAQAAKQAWMQTSDSAAVRGGGTVSRAGAIYPKGTQVAPAVGSTESGPTHHQVTTSRDSGGFGWSDAGIAAGISVGVLFVLSLFAVRIHRSKTTPAAA